ncbi:MAG TPA: hypothetical protein VKQ54_16410 [Caulobacteraceae bacterium]|nr:hypothetical protein [Caulobacteraceae bacterium]
MPTLRNPRYEAFAQARARGALLADAYESAGFVRHKGHPSRLACKTDVAERIAELRVQQTQIEDISAIGLLASLRRIIKAGEESKNPTLVNAARLAIVDASRLQAELARQQAVDQLQIAKDFKEFFTGAVPGTAPVASPVAAAPPPQPPRDLSTAAAPTPLRLPETAPRAPHKLLDSAARSPLVLPGLSTAPISRQAVRHCLVARPPIAFLR